VSVSLADRWLAHAAPLFDRERWSQGRWHARAGRVVALDVEPGLVVARLEGGQAVPRRVTVRVPPLDPLAQRRAFDVVERQAKFGAALAAGYLPLALDDALRAVDVWLLPRHHETVRLTCTCSDSRKHPCKHEAAVCIALADRIDADPFTLFTLRGIDRQQLLTVLRVRRAAPTMHAWFESSAFELLSAALHGAVTRHATAELAALDAGDAAATLDPAAS
jgi:uncharacterized Zn finger protein